MRIFPTSTLLFQPVRLLFWAMISILGKNSNTWTNKIGIIRLYFGSIFPPVRLFQPVRLLILTKFHTSTFIHTSMFIWDFRVHCKYILWLIICNLYNFLLCTSARCTYDIRYLYPRCTLQTFTVGLHWLLDTLNKLY